MFKAFELHALPRFQADALSGGPADQAGDPGVRVLDVVHGVVHGLAGDLLDVEVQRRVRGPRQKRVPGGVGADLVEKLVKRDQLAGPLAHLDLLAAPVQRHQLVEDELQPLEVDAQRLGRPGHALHGAVVIGSPHVDEPVVAPAILVQEVGGVLGEVGRGAGASDQDPVLVVAEVGGAEPHRALVLVDEAGLAEALHGLGHQAARLQIALGLPRFEGDPEPGQRGPDALERSSEALLLEGRPPLLGRGGGPPAAVILGDGLAQFFQVLASITLLRHGSVDAQRLEVAGLQGLDPQVHLASGVIEVVLAVDPVAAFRAVPTCSGPVGLAETNSTMTRSPLPDSALP